MATRKGGHRYVSLLSVIEVAFTLLSMFGLICFGMAFLYDWIARMTEREVYDYFNLTDSFQSILFIILIFMILVVILIILFRTVYVLNHPNTVFITIEYMDGNQKVIMNAPLYQVRDEVKKNFKANERYQKLTAIDARYPEHIQLETTDGINLTTLCNRFRAFCANLDKPLYYSIEDIRRFIASLGVSHILLLQGMSGTGKTSLPVAWGRFIRLPASVIPVQPMWKERSDLIGYFNEFTGKFNESELLEALYEANKMDGMKFIILDEMNIARVEYYFAEFLSILELPTKEGRVIQVATSVTKDDPVDLREGRLQLPDWVWFIGTANNDDSTFAISDKVYDRSMVMNLDYRCDPFVLEGEDSEITISGKDFLDMVDKAKKEYQLTTRGKLHLREFDEYMKETFAVSYGNRIRMQIESYVPIYIACGGTEEQALDDMMCKKVLRKLEAQNPVYVKAHAEDLIAKMNEIFGEGRMKVCEAYIRKLANNS